jgi:hypothetical protein
MRLWSRVWVVFFSFYFFFFLRERAGGWVGFGSGRSAGESGMKRRNLDGVRWGGGESPRIDDARGSRTRTLGVTDVFVQTGMTVYVRDTCFVGAIHGLHGLSSTDTVDTLKARYEAAKGITTTTKGIALPFPEP